MVMAKDDEEGRKMPRGFLRMGSIPQTANPKLRRKLERELRELRGDRGEEEG